jgi:Arc-like DNA binding domain
VARKPTDTAHLNLRYPEALRRRLERAAKNSRRSMNTEIVERLEQSFRREDFEKLQDAINEGMLKVIGVVSGVVRQMPPSAPRGLLSLLTPEQRAGVFDAQYFPKDQTATQEPAAPTDKGGDSK